MNHSWIQTFCLGKDGSKPCHCYLCESWDVCESRERASKVWPHSQPHGWLDQLLHLHVPRTSEAAQASSIVWATQGKMWSLKMVAMTVQTYNNLANRYYCFMKLYILGLECRNRSTLFPENHTNFFFIINTYLPNCNALLITTDKRINLGTFFT